MLVYPKFATALAFVTRGRGLRIMVGRGAADDVEMPDAVAGTLTRGDSETMLRVEDHGIVAVATTDAAALIGGARFLLPNRMWDGCEADDGRSRCSIVGYAAALGYIVRTDVDKCNWAFESTELLPHLPYSLKHRLRASLMEAELAAELEDEFDPADSASPPPDFGSLQLLSPAYARARNLHKVLWLSRRLGTRWAGGDAELQSAFDRERRRFSEAGRDRSGRDQAGRSRPRTESAHKLALTSIPPISYS